MKTFRDIHELAALNKATGHHWFDTDTKRYFGSRILPKLYGGKYFITSEYTGFEREGRAYTIREAREDGTIETVGEFLAYNTREDAVRAVKALCKPIPRRVS